MKRVKPTSTLCEQSITSAAEIDLVAPSIGYKTK